MDSLDLERHIERNVRALRDLYPRHVEAKVRNAPQSVLAELPVWIRGAVRLFEVPLINTAEPFLYLAWPNEDMPFEHLERVYQALVTKLRVPVLLIADALPPKHRPLLVKFNVAFIYRDESIYAPDLGLKIDRIGRFRPSQALELETRSEALSPFAVKIVAGLLTDWISPEFTLKSVHEMLVGQGAHYSMSKVSAVLIELAVRGLVLAGGAGPTRNFARGSRGTLWQKLLKLPIAPFFREYQSNYVPKDRSVYCVAGESALSHYSNLGTPARATIALTPGAFREIYQESKDTIPYGDFGDPNTVQIWKEQPTLFSKDGVMNQIEVFLSMKDHPDERVQMALDEMVRPFGLTREGI